MDTKYCNKCNTEKPTTDFFRNRTKRDGLCTICAACQTAYDKEYRKTHKPSPAQNRARHERAKKRALEDPEAADKLRMKYERARRWLDFDAHLWPEWACPQAHITLPALVWKNATVRTHRCPLPVGVWEDLGPMPVEELVDDTPCSAREYKLHPFGASGYNVHLAEGCWRI